MTRCPASSLLSRCAPRATASSPARLDLHRDGYGFVRPNGSESRDDDLFIPPNELNGAMQGDEVLVDEALPGSRGASRDGRRSGRIARVLTRRNPTVVGIFHYARKQRRGAWDDAPMLHGNYVTPLDERMAGAPGGGAILIPEGAEVPAAPKQTPASRTRRRGAVTSSEAGSTPSASIATTRSKASPSTSRSPTSPRPVAPPRAASSRSSAHPTPSAWMSRSSSASTTCRILSPRTCSPRPAPPPRKPSIR